MTISDRGARRIGFALLTMAFHGLCLAVIEAARTPGEIRLSASARGLQSEPVEIRVAQD